MRASHWLGFLRSFEQYETVLLTNASWLSGPKHPRVKMVATIKFIAWNLISASESSCS